MERTLHSQKTLKGLGEVLSKISKDQKIPADTQFKTGALCLKMYIT